MERIIITLTALLLTLLPQTVSASEPDATYSAKKALNDSLAVDSIPVDEDPPRKLSLIRRIIRGFDRLDENYIEPQHYVFTAMVQVTNTYDFFSLSSRENNGQSISFSPDVNVKAGPYVGWKWFFGGYTFSLGHSTTAKTDLDFSIYSSQIGIDLFYRRTGSDYKLRSAELGKGADTQALEDVPFSGIKIGITGANLYYIFNHGRFSYPAAFAQSTCQKISCGSWMVGLGYTNNTLELDHEQLEKLIEERLAPTPVQLDSGLMFKKVEYHDISMSAGYAYNWVFARNWLLSAGGSVGLGYKRSVGDMKDSSKKNFSIDNFAPNTVGRLGIVYNNTRWYAGFSAIIRSNRYRKELLSTHNTFGSMNAYIGYNFGLKKKYKPKEIENKFIF